MITRIEMNESTKIAAVGYANNQWHRRDIVYIRENILDAMPIGKPMRAKEICQAVAELGVVSTWSQNRTLEINPQSVVQCYNALEPYGIMKREVVSCEPFTIMVGGEWDYVNEEWVVVGQKPKVIDKVTVYTRLK